MIIDCISDLHGFKPELKGGDLLIIAGDVTRTDRPGEWDDSIWWMHEQSYRKKILIAGNHDKTLQMGEPYLSDVLEKLGITYLRDSGTEFEGLKIWGSPWTAWFEGINPHCTAFTKRTDELLDEKWALIPKDVNILITHMPMYTLFADIKYWDEDGNYQTKDVGSTSLWKRIIKKKEFPDLKLHVCGHIHEHGGQVIGTKIKTVNASIVNERYEHVNKPVKIEL